MLSFLILKFYLIGNSLENTKTLVFCKPFCSHFTAKDKNRKNTQESLLQFKCILGASEDDACITLIDLSGFFFYFSITIVI